jgi:hypothetical protein
VQAFGAVTLTLVTVLDGPFKRVVSGPTVIMPTLRTLHLVDTNNQGLAVKLTK